MTSTSVTQTKDTAVQDPAAVPVTGGTANQNRPKGQQRRFKRMIRDNGWLAVPSFVLLLVLLWSIIPGLFTVYDPFVGVTADRLQPPSAEHLFGTDRLGRDLYTRVVHGAASTLSSGALAVAIGFCLGTVIGLLSGFLGGRTDGLVMRFVDVLLSIPSLLLSMAIITALGFGTTQVAVAVGVAIVGNFARVMRAETLKVMTNQYVEAAVASGVRKVWVLARHVLPNAIGPVLALAVLEFGAAILHIAALSFLGFGAQPPAPEWGSMIAGGRDYLATAWWLTAFPGLVLAAVVLSVNSFRYWKGRR